MDSPEPVAAPMRLSELQARLAQLAGEALNRSDEDPRVEMYDRYGGIARIYSVRLDWQPETLAEADADVRHPVVQFLPPEEAS